MKLLFDENLSPALPRRVADLFPNSVHVRDVGMKATDDPIVLDNVSKNHSQLIIFAFLNTFAFERNRKLLLRLAKR